LLHMFMLVASTLSLVFCRIRLHPICMLFPYTTLFRSDILARYDKLADYHFVLEADKDAWVFADPLKISQVVYNLGYFQRIGKYRSEEHTSELQSRFDLVCRLLLEKKNNQRTMRCHVKI